MAEKDTETIETGKKGYNPFGGGSTGSTTQNDQKTPTDEYVEMPDDSTIGKKEESSSSSKFEDATIIDEGQSSGSGGKKKNMFDELREEAEKDKQKQGSEGGGGTGGGGGGGSESTSSGSSKESATEADTGMSDDFAQYTAKWLVDIYAQTFCMFLKNYAKIDKKTVYEAILSGHLDERFLKFIDEQNKKVDEGIVFTDEQKKFIIEPLTRFVKVNKVKVPSGMQLLIGLGVVSGSVFMTANELRKDNEYLLQKIILESQKIRRENNEKRGRRESDTLEREEENSSQEKTDADSQNDSESDNKKENENNGGEYVPAN